MADRTISLRAFRKKRARDDRERQAEANRAHHGQTKAERKRVAAERERNERTLEGARIERDD